MEICGWLPKAVVSHDTTWGFLRRTELLRACRMNRLTGYIAIRPATLGFCSTRRLRNGTSVRADLQTSPCQIPIFLISRSDGNRADSGGWTATAFMSSSREPSGRILYRPGSLYLPSGTLHATRLERYGSRH